MRLADLAKQQQGLGQHAAAPQGQVDVERLRRAATEVLRIFDTGVGNAGITGSDWLLAMAQLRAALEGEK